MRTSSKQLWYAWYALFVLKITEMHAQEYFENGLYIPQLFKKFSPGECKCLNGVAVEGWNGPLLFFARAQWVIVNKKFSLVQ